MAPLASELSRLIDERETWSAFRLKPELRAYLGARQNWRCAYCEQSIENQAALDETELVVEHFCPRSRASSEAASCFNPPGTSADFDLNNLLLCCSGHAAGPANVTCDECKGSAHVCGIVPNPNTELAHAIEEVRPSGEYRIESARFPAANSFCDSAKRGSGLNLNQQSLVDARTRVFAAVARRVADEGLRGRASTEIRTSLEQLASTKPFRTVYSTVARRVGMRP